MLADAPQSTIRISHGLFQDGTSAELAKHKKQTVNWHKTIGQSRPQVSNGGTSSAGGFGRWEDAEAAISFGSCQASRKHKHKQKHARSRTTGKKLDVTTNTSHAFTLPPDQCPPSAQPTTPRDLTSPAFSTTPLDFQLCNMN